MGELKAEDIRASVVTLQDYGAASTSMLPQYMDVDPNIGKIIGENAKKYLDEQMTIDYRTPEEISDEESLWEE